eukprot:m.37465 g.37465  ORF g.37465 m.37465 type:complete len:57 (-) comp10095_c0_seq1:1504-1674(-)
MQSAALDDTTLIDLLSTEYQPSTPTQNSTVCDIVITIFTSTEFRAYARATLLEILD